MSKIVADGRANDRGLRLIPTGAGLQPVRLQAHKGPQRELDGPIESVPSFLLVTEEVQVALHFPGFRRTAEGARDESFQHLARGLFGRGALVRLLDKERFP